jgi:ribose transport system substrate-binding protein
MRKVKVIAGVLAILLVAAGLGGCKSSTSSTNSSSSSTTSVKSKQVILISKTFASTFYSVCYTGAKDAAKKYGLTVTVEGPDVESDVQQQVDMVNAAINKRPAAIVLAACDASSLTSQMEKCKSLGIAVIGFDSGVPGDTSGAVVATVATDNTTAGALAADNLFASTAFQAAIAKGTTADPTVLGVLSQDSISGSIIQRDTGFINEMVKKLQTLTGLQNAVEVTGQSIWNKASSSTAKVDINVVVPPTTNASDVQTAATTALGAKNLVAIYASNQTTVDGVLSATNDGTDLDKTSGKFKNLIVVGFDADKNQKAAVKSNEFLGSVTQNPYAMGYDAVQLASEALAGQSVSNMDTGALWYNSSNMAQSNIAQLLYN